MFFDNNISNSFSKLLIGLLLIINCSNLGIDNIALIGIDVNKLLLKFNSLSSIILFNDGGNASKLLYKINNISNVIYRKKWDSMKKLQLSH